MENTVYQSLISELSESEKQIFEKLLTRVQELKGDMSQLSPEEQSQLSQLMSTHHSEEDAKTQLEFDTVSAAETSEKQTSIVSNVSEVLRPMETEFGAYLIDAINESLCQGGASTADAIRYAFHNKWMPDKLKNRDICEDLYYRFIDDIELANQGIGEQSTSHSNNDTVVAVGLAWFTNLYRCYQLVEAEGEI